MLIVSKVWPEESSIVRVQPSILNSVKWIGVRVGEELKVPVKITTERRAAMITVEMVTDTTIFFIKGHSQLSPYDSYEF
jgi:hypothetical protein